MVSADADLLSIREVHGIPILDAAGEDDERADDRSDLPGVGCGLLHLDADARHLLTDVWTTIGVFVGVVLVQVTGWLRLDPLVAALSRKAGRPVRVCLSINESMLTCRRLSATVKLKTAVDSARRQVEDWGGVVVAVVPGPPSSPGTRPTRLNLILAIADLCTQVILVAIGLALVFSPSILVDNVHFGVAPSWGDFLLGIAVGMIAYTGIETISNMSEEAKDASKTIPKGVGLTVAAVLGLYALLPLIALSAMPVHHVGGHYSTDLGTKFAGDPVLGIVENLGLSGGLTNVLRYYVGVLAAVILLIATNAGLIGVSRLTFSMGHYRQLPERLRQVHPKYRTPYIAILVFSAIAIITPPGAHHRLSIAHHNRTALLSKSHPRVTVHDAKLLLDPGFVTPFNRRHRFFALDDLRILAHANDQRIAHHLAHVFVV